MAPIQRLSTHLVNKIAAGEVIERPASVVKELIENALDAGATRIEVTIEEGGKQLISVSDDGCGMAAEDLKLAFVPHATSKLHDEEDLFAINTMGFRGEALASVASISHAHIRTRQSESDSGYEISASGDTLEELRPTSAGPGTTVTIRDLFFNTPARRKFLKTPGTEIGHISEQLAHLAIPHPQVAFALTHNGRKMQNLPATATTAQRVSDLFGRELGETLIPLVSRKGPVEVTGLIAPPSAARSTGKWQYFFLNGRYIRDRMLAHALREAYRGLTDPNRFPVAFIFLRMDPGEVDVNVHPTKIEVRFRDSHHVYAELLAALKETLNRARLTPDMALKNDPAQSPISADTLEGEEARPFDPRQESLRQAMAEFFQSAPRTQPSLEFPHTSSSDSPAREYFRPAAIAERPQPLEAARCEAASPATASQPPPARRFRAIQFHNAYLLVEEPNGFVIIDQHALHERLIYNDLKQRLAEGKLSSQRMLIPETFPVTAGEMAILEDRQELLQSLGIEVASFGPATAAIQQFPLLLIQRGISAKAFLREMLDTLREDETADRERLLEELLEMMACKAAVKAGDPLSSQEIDSLLSRREAADKNASCPHGRPTTIRLTMGELEKQFKRA
jgi:DNA mismatch repair protein MutL